MVYNTSKDKEKLSMEFLKKAYEMILKDSTITKYQVGSEIGLDPNETIEIATILTRKHFLDLLDEQKPMEQVAKRSDFEITEEGKKICMAS